MVPQVLDAEVRLRQQRRAIRSRGTSRDRPPESAESFAPAFSITSSTSGFSTGHNSTAKQLPVRLRFVPQSAAVRPQNRARDVKTKPCECAPPAETGGTILRDAPPPARYRGNAPPPDRFPGRPKCALRGGPRSPDASGCCAPGSRTPAAGCDDRPAPAASHRSISQVTSIPASRREGSITMRVSSSTVPRSATTRFAVAKPRVRPEEAIFSRPRISDPSAW